MSSRVGRFVPWSVALKRMLACNIKGGKEVNIRPSSWRWHQWSYLRRRVSMKIPKLRPAGEQVRDPEKPCATAVRCCGGELWAYLGRRHGQRKRPWTWRLRLWEASWRIDWCIRWIQGIDEYWIEYENCGRNWVAVVVGVVEVVCMENAERVGKCVWGGETLFIC